jgi:hypothetical protein
MPSIHSLEWELQQMTDCDASGYRKSREQSDGAWEEICKFIFSFWTNDSRTLLNFRNGWMAILTQRNC